MKVLIVSHHALPHVGGLEGLIDLEIRALIAHGCKVVLVTSDAIGQGTNPVYESDVEIIRVPAWHFLEKSFGIPYPIFAPQIVQTCCRMIKECDIVHVHGFMFMNSFIALVLSSLLNKPSVLTDHGGIQKFSSSLVTCMARIGAETVGRMSSSLATTIIAYNHRVLETLMRLRRRQDGIFLPNPVDTRIFVRRTPESQRAARLKLGWPIERTKLVFIGRLIPAKGVPLLINIADPSQYDIVFCGPGDVSMLGLPRAGVEYLPPRPQAELVSVYHAADIILLPSGVREGFPLVAQEALTCGVPVVLGYDPGFEPYRYISGLYFCQPSVENLKSVITNVLQYQDDFSIERTSDIPFPNMLDWGQKLLDIFNFTIEKFKNRERRL